MIARYSRPEMTDLWSEKGQFDAWLDVELAACWGWSQIGAIPSEDVDALYEKASFSMERIAEIEKETRHDVVAFTRAVSETLGDERKWVHYGLTSTDVVDTAWGVRLKRANALIREALHEMKAVLARRAREHKTTLMMGRTHGVHAEPTTFGLVLALYYAEIERQIERFELAAKGVEVGKLSGAVGTFAHTPPEVERLTCERLGLEAAPISTQTLAARPPRVLPVDVGGHRGESGEDGRRGAPPAAIRGTRGRGGVSIGAERIVGDAAQAQPYRIRKRHRHEPPAQRLHGERVRKRRAVARARHQPLVRRARHPARCHDGLPLCTDADDEYSRHADGLSRCHARQHGPHLRAAQQPARDARPRRGGAEPRGRLRPRPAARDAGVDRTASHFSRSSSRPTTSANISPKSRSTRSSTQSTTRAASTRSSRVSGLG